MADIDVAAEYEATAVTLSDNVQAGIIAGITGAVLMAMWSMGYAAAQGLGLFLPLKLIAATVFGVEALVGDAGVLLTALVIHLLTASAWGILFALLLPRHIGMAAGLVAGLVYGLVVLFAMTYIVMPVANETFRERVELTTFSWYVTHLIYGAVLGLAVPWLREKLAD